MSYATQARMARDQELFDRISACAATLEVKSPLEWVWGMQWVWAVQPGWDDAYAYAISSQNEHPGNDENVITDGMIFAAVSTIVGLYAPILQKPDTAASDTNKLQTSDAKA